MQKACEQNPSTMAAVLGLADEKVEQVCAEVQDDSGEIVDQLTTIARGNSSSVEVLKVSPSPATA